MSLRPDDLPADTTPDDRAALASVAQRLDDGRPYPGAAFRSRLRAALFDPRRVGPFAALRPAYGLAGSALLALAGLGPLGVGPFAA